MSEGLGDLDGGQLLLLAVDRLLVEDPAVLDPAVALARAAVLLTVRERLQAAALTAVRDVDVRELYVLERAGSTRSWLRRQLGGDAGQLGLARRLAARPVVAAALAGGLVSQRAAGQLCAVLDVVPDQVDEPRLAAVLQDGLRSLLGTVLGGSGADPDRVSAQTFAVRAQVDAVVDACLADTLSPPADRLAPALLLLAEHLPAGQLGWALAQLLDPDEPGPPQRSRFFLALQPLLDGEWDLRGHLDPETGSRLAAELDRQQRAAAAAAEAIAAAAAEASRGDFGAQPDSGAQPDPGAEPDSGTQLDAHTQPDPAVQPGRDAHDSPGGADVDADGFVADLSGPVDPSAGSGGRAVVPVGTRRHDALCQLLRDAADVEAGSGRPGPAALSITTTLAQLEGRPGALPALLRTPGAPVPLPRQTLLRLGCFSELNLVVLDALGRPVGASTTLRSATRRQRAALQATWGPWCAIAGCTSTQTVPHHVRPWWLSRQTVLRDLLPLCEHDHRDLHEDHRTLRLRDGRLIDEHGWVDEPHAAAAA